MGEPSPMSLHELVQRATADAERGTYGPPADHIAGPVHVEIDPAHAYEKHDNSDDRRNDPW